MNNLLTASEVATILKIHINTVYYYLVTRKLKGHRVIGNRWRIKAADLETFINGAESTHADANNNKQERELVAGSAPTSK